MAARPPDTALNPGLVALATRPALKFPSCGTEAPTTSSVAETRPRSVRGRRLDHRRAQSQAADVGGVGDREREQPIALGSQILGVGGHPRVADQQRRRGAPPQAGRRQGSVAPVTGRGRSRYPRTLIITNTTGRPLEA